MAEFRLQKSRDDLDQSRSRGGVLEFLMVCSFLSLFSWYRSLADVIANRELDGA